MGKPGPSAMVQRVLTCQPRYAMHCSHQRRICCDVHFPISVLANLLGCALCTFSSSVLDMGILVGDSALAFEDVMT